MSRTAPSPASARNNARLGRGDVKPRSQRSIYDSVEQEMTNVRAQNDRIGKNGCILSAPGTGAAEHRMSASTDSIEG